jgi:hypothetical protein
MHQTMPLIVTLASGFGLALVLGFIAARIGLPALVGYLLAGVLIGPAALGAGVATWWGWPIKAAIGFGIALSVASTVVLLRAPEARVNSTAAMGAEADSLTVQKELVAGHPGLYSILGPYAFAAELRSGRLQATRLVRPDLVRHVMLALPRQGKVSPACRIVAQTVQELVNGWGRQLTEP